MAILCLMLLLTAVMYAGDIATFVNLGFSDDSRNYMFGYYGADEMSAKLYAELYIVDVRANRFVPSGSKKSTGGEQISPGQDGIGALFALYKGAVGLVQTHGINHMKTGRLLYLLVDGEEPKAELDFRDFETGRSYAISLIQTSTGSEDSASSAFHINVTATSANGLVQRYVVGLPGYFREGVRKYRILQILSSPDESSLVFVVEKEQAADSGVNVRYMIETLHLK